MIFLPHREDKFHRTFNVGRFNILMQDCVNEFTQELQAQETVNVFVFAVRAIKRFFSHIT